MDGSSISHAGASGTSWRLHAAYNPCTSSFTDLELTGPEGGEDFAKFSFSQSDVVVGDRGYAKPYDLQHVLTAGANFVVRVGWNSMRLITPDGERINLAAIYDTLGPGETTELSVIVTRRNKGPGRRPRPLFPARLVIMRQNTAAAERATKAARRQHNRKRPEQALKSMTLTSANYLMILTSLTPEAATVARIMEIYRLRWQIELAFKRLKSGLGIHRLVARDPQMARSWLLSHLILALIIEDVAGEVLDSPPCALRWRQEASFPLAFARRFASSVDWRGCPNGINLGPTPCGIHYRTPSLRVSSTPTMSRCCRTAEPTVSIS